MKDILTTIFALMIIVTVILWMVAIALGGVEILWWIFTGGFFHFMSTGAEVAF